MPEYSARPLVLGSRVYSCVLIRLMSFHCVIHHLVIVIILLDASWSIRFLDPAVYAIRRNLCTREARGAQAVLLYAPAAVYTSTARVNAPTCVVRTRRCVRTPGRDRNVMMKIMTQM